MGRYTGIAMLRSSKIFAVVMKNEIMDSDKYFFPLIKIGAMVIAKIIHASIKEMASKRKCRINREDRTIGGKNV